MVIVLGSVTVTEDAIEEALKLSLEHVRRSRDEPGCLAHCVHIDAEDSNRLVFLERWQDMDALQEHFKVPAAGQFVRALSAHATSEPQMKIFNASEIPRH